MAGMVSHPEQFENETTQTNLPGHVLRYVLYFKDPTYEMALTSGTPTALLIKDLQFVSIGNINIVRPRQTGSLHFKHIAKYVRGSSIYRLI